MQLQLTSLRILSCGTLKRIDILLGCESRDMHVIFIKSCLLNGWARCSMW